MNEDFKKKLDYMSNKMSSNATTTTRDIRQSNELYTSNGNGVDRLEREMDSVNNTSEDAPLLVCCMHIICSM